MKKKLLIGVLAAFMLVTVGCEKAPKLSDGKEVVAEINGKQFTTEELYENLKKSAGTTILVNMVDEYIANLEISDNEDAEKYADSQLKQTKLQIENSGENFKLALLNYGYENEEAYRKELLVNYKKQQVAEKYYKDNLTDKEIEKYYNEKVDGDITVRHILIKPEVTSTMTTEEKTTKENEALEKAKDLIKKLNEGADFAELAKDNSADGSASQGGLLSAFNRESNFVEEFIDASYKLEIGKYTTEPVKTTHGYHIIFKENQKEKPSLEEVRNSIIDKLVDEKLNASEDSGTIAWKEVRKKYNINIIDSYMKNIYNSAMEGLNN